MTPETSRALKRAIKQELRKMTSLGEQQLFVDDLICSPPKAGDLVAELMELAGNDAAPAELRALGMDFCAWLLELRRALKTSFERRRAASTTPVPLEEMTPTDVRALN